MEIAIIATSLQKETDKDGQNTGRLKIPWDGSFDDFRSKSHYMLGVKSLCCIAVHRVAHPMMGKKLKIDVPVVPEK